MSFCWLNVPEKGAAQIAGIEQNGYQGVQWSKSWASVSCQDTPPWLASSLRGIITG